jgi:hypothetical protein
MKVQPPCHGGQRSTTAPQEPENASRTKNPQQRVRQLALQPGLGGGTLTLPSGARLAAVPSDRSLRLRVRLRRRVLDREIAAGLSAGGDAARALRARQLTCARERWCVAVCLANIVEAADERQADPTSPLTLNHPEVLAARDDIAALIDALRGDQAIAPRGAALARLLAQSSASPLVRPRAGCSVQQAVSEAISAL